MRRLALVDITPGTCRAKAASVTAFVTGPDVFASFDEILRRTIAFNPGRTEASLRRGILHNARRREDRSWAWRYDRAWAEGWAVGDASGRKPTRPSPTPLWDDVSRLAAPLMLVRGGHSHVVGDEDVAELRRRQSAVRVEVVAESGHSVQGDQPVPLARLLDDFVSTTA